ncbi:MAG TPA: AarF/UbiB family protein [Candidatus Udaeobacter sp.]|jgi:predicted unusual protein kinase regulating ubiquinone biosynthesis (AarF/ABC1/UbiB family)|nr:AarF/UbiB family protein [Candidatus Udaeobacter sp.]
MGISLKPAHLQRYRDITRLLIRYGNADVVRRAGLEDAELPEPEPSARGTNGKAPPVDPVATQQAKQLADDLEAMGPTFIKIGQFMSTRADFLPRVTLEALTRLQDRIEPFPFADVERIVFAELGVRISKAFASFEETPIAAASLGQVHRAELRSGRTVAVKVQRPGVRECTAQDLEVLGEIAAFVDGHSEAGRLHGFQDMLDEFRKSLMRELDYRQEARHLSMLSGNLAGLRHIVVPSPVEDYSTSRVLTMEFIHGRKVTALGPLAKLEFNGLPLAVELCRAYLRQILVDGFFHADPHPGNIFLTEDGKLALLDLGMVARLSPTMQEDLLKLVLAISEGRGEDAGDVVIRIGQPTPGADSGPVRRQIAERVVNIQGLALRDIALGRLLFETVHIAAAGGFRPPRELTLLAKTLLNVDETARRLDPDFDPNAEIRTYAAEIMRRRMLRSLSPGKVFAGVLELKELAEQLPRRLNQLIDAVAENRIRVHVDAFDEVLLMEGLQKIANRITLGLVLSAMIVGAALLMRIDTSFRILGYPALAILCFLGAALGGVLMVGNILLNDLKASKERLRSPRK